MRTIYWWLVSLLALYQQLLLGLVQGDTIVETVVPDAATTEPRLREFFGSTGHTNNWAVLVCTSRYWFNYRHIADTLSIYRTVKRLGIPDTNIILMLADDVACNGRNAYPGTVYNSASKQLELVGQNIEVDYRGYDVTVENFIRLLTGRHTPEVPRSKRLLTDDRSNILIFMAGHGGDDFLKFQDAEEIGGQDIADAIAQMHEKRRYHEILFMIDTCQANTLYERIDSPNVLATGSSERGENSYSYQADGDLGVAVIDRYTYYTLKFMENVNNKDNSTTFQQLFDTFNFDLMRSNHGVRLDLYSKSLDKVSVMDFFGGMQSAELTHAHYPITDKHKQLSVELNKKDKPNNKDAASNDNQSKAQSASTVDSRAIFTTFALFTGIISVLAGTYTLFNAIDAKLFN
ncbi:peptidase C13 family-domain-containing protein [Syncephalis fuscata]|nr:peptidase C13 family-domain-containing protein [Syncephalis fuscata]